MYKQNMEFKKTLLDMHQTGEVYHNPSKTISLIPETLDTEEGTSMEGWTIAFNTLNTFWWSYDIHEVYAMCKQFDIKL